MRRNILAHPKPTRGEFTEQRGEKVNVIIIKTSDPFYTIKLNTNKFNFPPFFPAELSTFRHIH
jgi:hypothetical protein